MPDTKQTRARIAIEVVASAAQAIRSAGQLQSAWGGASRTLTKEFAALSKLKAPAPAIDAAGYRRAARDGARLFRTEFLAAVRQSPVTVPVRIQVDRAALVRSLAQPVRGQIAGSTVTVNGSAGAGRQQVAAAGAAAPAGPDPRRQLALGSVQAARVDLASGAIGLPEYRSRLQQIQALIAGEQRYAALHAAIGAEVQRVEVRVAATARAEAEKVAKAKERSAEREAKAVERSAEREERARQRAADRAVRLAEQRARAIERARRREEAEAARVPVRRAEVGRILAEGLSGAGAVGTFGYSAPVAAIGVRGLMGAAALEQTTDVLQAQTGASNAQIGRARALAGQLGADPNLAATTSKDAAVAMLEQAKAGRTLAESMSGARGVLELAAAAQIEEADAARIAADNLNAFRLAGDQTARVADILAAAALNSSGEMVHVADALRQSASVYGDNKIQIEDLAASYMTLAQAGMIGQDAGTSLRTMLRALLDPSKEAKAVMGALGVSVFDASGKMKPWRDIIVQFETALGDYNQESRAMALSTIFGADAMRAASITFGRGVKVYDENRKKATEVGVAHKVAAAQTKGFQGALDAFVSAADTFLEETATPYLNTLTAWVRKGTEFVNGLGEMPPAARNAAVAVALVTAAVFPLAFGIGGVLRAVSFLARGFAEVRLLAGPAAAANAQVAASAGAAAAASNAEAAALTRVAAAMGAQSAAAGTNTAANVAASAAQLTLGQRAAQGAMAVATLGSKGAQTGGVLSRLFPTFAGLAARVGGVGTAVGGLVTGLGGLSGASAAGFGALAAGGAIVAGLAASLLIAYNRIAAIIEAYKEAKKLNAETAKAEAARPRSAVRRDEIVGLQTDKENLRALIAGKGDEARGITLATARETAAKYGIVLGPGGTLGEGAAREGRLPAVEAAIRAIDERITALDRDRKRAEASERQTFAGGRDQRFVLRATKPYEPYIQQYSKAAGLSPALVRAVIYAESGGKANEVSPAGARGLMQLMPDTARGLGVTNPMNPEQNIRGGVEYLRQMMVEFGGDVPLALAAYNAGPGAVKKYKGIPPFKETQGYVKKITGLLGISSTPGDTTGMFGTKALEVPETGGGEDPEKDARAGRAQEARGQAEAAKKRLDKWIGIYRQFGAIVTEGRRGELEGKVEALRKEWLALEGAALEAEQAVDGDAKSAGAAKRRAGLLRTANDAVGAEFGEAKSDVRKAIEEARARNAQLKLDNDIQELENQKAALDAQAELLAFQMEEVAELPARRKLRAAIKQARIDALGLEARVAALRAEAGLPTDRPANPQDLRKRDLAIAASREKWLAGVTTAAGEANRGNEEDERGAAGRRAEELRRLAEGFAEKDPTAALMYLRQAQAAERRAAGPVTEADRKAMMDRFRAEQKDLRTRSGMNRKEQGPFTDTERAGASGAQTVTQAGARMAAVRAAEAEGLRGEGRGLIGGAISSVVRREKNAGQAAEDFAQGLAVAVQEAFGRITWERYFAPTMDRVMTRLVDGLGALVEGANAGAENVLAVGMNLLGMFGRGSSPRKRRGGIWGSILGAVVGSFIPGVGPWLGASIGGQLGQGNVGGAAMTAGMAFLGGGGAGNAGGGGGGGINVRNGGVTSAMKAGRARGGPVMPGVTYEILEGGMAREFFMPSVPGRMFPEDQMRARFGLTSPAGGGGGWGGGGAPPGGAGGGAGGGPSGPLVHIDTLNVADRPTGDYASSQLGWKVFRAKNGGGRVNRP